ELCSYDFEGFEEQHFDMGFIFSDENKFDSFDVDITYREDLFDKLTIERMGEHFKFLCEQIFLDDSSTKPISRIQHLLPVEEEQLKQLDLTRINFDALFDENKHNQLMKEGVRTISYRATQAALLICLYRDQPILHQPFRLITLLVDIDEMFTTWRYRHALMVHRMIGTKIGTGGSSGHQYLKGTSDQHKIFSDFFNLSTFLIPRSSLPKLPGDVERNLGFVYSQKQ
ncbi:MAG TPA: tryptophan 2,3-dioxygenase family protein, partial [bacterium]|nr:tryptophan 2,3-dioxygenase family protein [bacterium]